MGCYNNFPTRIHGVATLMFQPSAQRVQQSILHTLCQLNRETLELNLLTQASPPNCKVNFEFGIADEDSFNFLDGEEISRLERCMEKEEPLRILDFFCATRYYTTAQNGKAKPLRFDYAMLRFTFQRKTIEVFVAHERGTQRIPLEDLLTFIINRINLGLVEKGFKALAIERIRTL